MFCDRTLAAETFYLLSSLLAACPTDIHNVKRLFCLHTSRWSYNVLDTGSCYNCATNLKNNLVNSENVHSTLYVLIFYLQSSFI